MRVLIIVPAYNEEKNLPKLIYNLKLHCPGYDILVINDCSCDRTCDISKCHGIRMVELPVNLGIGGAVQAGYRYAHQNCYDIAVQVDGDGQHNPKYIGRLVDGILKGNNLCIGSRFIEKEGFQSTFTRRLGIIYFSKLIKFFSGQAVTDPTSGFRACDRKLIGFFSKEYPRDYPEPETVVAVIRQKFRVSEVPVKMHERQEGRSSITSLKSIYYLIKVSLAVIIASFQKIDGRSIDDE